MKDAHLYTLDGWALVLGASSGFGEATSIALARAGMNIIGVHLDRRAGMAHVEEIKRAIQDAGREALFFNVNAADETKRNETLDEIKRQLDAKGGKIRVLLHSLAFGTLKPYWSGSEDPASNINKANMDMTLDVMAHSLVYWTQDTLRRGLFGDDARIYGMTSAGNTTVWSGYGAVSAAKCALESHLRQLAIELAPHGISANAIEAGVTDTPALAKIPGSDVMKQQAIARNPSKRLTTVQDVAQCIVALSMPATRWMTGNVIRVDGGEKIAG
ncbi:Short-chain dehydrogenase [Sandaracinus amylolyticus]|nr:Short-chain dehydrogenase [Sandaracinus amylolyticus]